MVMQGMTWASLKKHRALIPLYVCIAAGGIGAIGYTLRLALRNPDVAWANKAEGSSNEQYRTKQYKFYSPNVDYDKLESPAPKY
ncbi:hypothetical protein ILUMI_11618 [Ignelater luminosus]|uniref:Cytochrome c oxidase subunit NDUFA4 n=1 Tax=Ignelater luminosus TaxID=2038154 RepID=A0A8K0G7J6_IGNLU|nr:hypothetical protein ILUMI_11618 [Ignelater luminosus]